MLLLGHRGARRYAPENTLAAFDLALEHGAHGFEFDVRATSNHQAIICHDPKLYRMSVSRHTLKQLRAASDFHGHALPLLSDVLERYTQSAFLNIEIKVRGIERLVAHAVRQHPPQRGYLISTFLPGVVRKLHQLDPSLVLGTLSQSRWQLRRWARLPAAYVVPHYRLLSRRLVEEIHRAGKRVVTWTVNDPKKMLRAADMGVDGIISDDTVLLCKMLGDRKRNW